MMKKLGSKDSDGGDYVARALWRCLLRRNALFWRFGIETERKPLVRKKEDKGVELLEVLRRTQ